MRHLPSAQLVTALAIAVLTCCGAGCGGTTKTIIEVRTPAALQAPALAPYRVPSASMEPTLAIGETVWVQAIEQLAPQVGDIVIFNPPKNAEQQICGPTPHMVTPGGAACATPEPEPASVKFVKRIVAGPSDTLYIKEGHVYINGKRESDPYITPCGAASECRLPDAYQGFGRSLVPDGRQPRRVRRQSFLGTRSRLLDHWPRSMVWCTGCLLPDRLEERSFDIATTSRQRAAARQEALATTAVWACPNPPTWGRWR